MTTSPGKRSAEARVRIPLSTLRDPVHLFALGFGSGLAPFAPGTFGSVVGLAIGLACLAAGFDVLVVGTVIACVAGVWICGQSARKLGVHDHPAIVWDEVAGMMLTLWTAPQTWWGALLAFGLFRLFDVWKPWPIRQVDHGLHGGAGIMLDDILAALWAAAMLAVIRHFT